MCLYARAVGRGRGFDLSIAIQVIDTKPARVASADELWGLIAFRFAATCHPERYPAKDLGSGIRLLQPRSFAGALRMTGYGPNRNRTDTSTSRRTQRSTRLYAVAVGHRSGVDHSKTLSNNVGCAGRTSRASGFHLQRSAIELRARHRVVASFQLPVASIGKHRPSFLATGNSQLATSSMHPAGFEPATSGS